MPARQPRCYHCRMAIAPTWRHCLGALITAVIALCPVLAWGGAHDVGRDLIEAARRGDAAEITQLLAQGATVGGGSKSVAWSMLIMPHSQPGCPKRPSRHAANGISASHMRNIAAAMEVPVSFFFEGLARALGDAA